MLYLIFFTFGRLIRAIPYSIPGPARSTPHPLLPSKYFVSLLLRKLETVCEPIATMQGALPLLGKGSL